MKSPITTHVLDTSLGQPAEGVDVNLEMLLESGEWKKIGQGKTNSDGRVNELLPAGHALTKGLYKLTFDTDTYFKKKSAKSFYPFVPIVFEIHDTQSHYHVPLLLSPFGYSTYRGS